MDINWVTQAQLLAQALLGVTIFDKDLNSELQGAELVTTDEGEGFAINFVSGGQFTMIARRRLPGVYGDKIYQIHAESPNGKVDWFVQGPRKMQAIKLYGQCMGALKPPPPKKVK